ncbi:Cytochrome P450-CM2 [Hyphodiscus hymeniophilus]|uniref:Cytochrome P450-CM2 n=1 Tax=Hyphodiscus hymeniophilus TaxID=353542 RepID=A0A9P6VH69_9HELO|nr:Cytochrome P450-CM2 [Hyphodiscus hymeniophilus]
MARLFLKEAALLFIFWAIYKQFQNWLRWRALKQFGAKYGCGAAPAIPNKLPGGLERYAILFTGFKGMDFLEDMIRARFTEMGCNTYRIFGLFNSSIVTTAEPENIQAILGTKFHDFDLGPSRRENFHDMLGNGIFTAEGEAWARYRSQLKPQFTRDQVSDLETADRHLQALFKALPQQNTDGWIESVDIQPYLYRFTMDASTEFLFGESFQDSSKTRKVQGDMDFAEAITYAQEYLFWRIRLRGLYWLAKSKRFKYACKVVKDFGDVYVRKALDPNYKRASVGSGQKEKFVMLDAMVAETRDPVELRDQILHLLLAGRDTTSALLSWTILLLARNPEEFEKLRDVVIDTFGTEEEPKQKLTFTSLKACKAITYVLYEAMRLYPLLPINGRVALRDTVLPTGGGPDRKQPLAIMKGEQVGYSIYVMHRRADIWGEDADEFVPKRWEGRKLGWEYLPFSGGPRVCLGREYSLEKMWSFADELEQYALNEASFVVVSILRRFDKIEALHKGPVRKSLSLTLSPMDGVKVKMHRAVASS